ncbi:MAG: 3-oxoadipate enol-lactonase [Azovibrio sp.]
MSYANLSQVRLYYTVDGPADGPVLLFSNSLGTNGDMWAPQIPELTRHYKVVRYDTRGHGQSSTPEGEYTLARLAGDVVELLDYLEIKKASFCGLSMGGPTGLQFALDYPERLEKLVLCNTAARVGSFEGWSARIAAIQEQSLEAMAPSLIERWLSPGFREQEPVQTRTLIDMMRRNPEPGYIGNCAALRDADLRDKLGSITVPTLVISGTLDQAATTEQGRELAAGIIRSRYVELEASHLSNWEQPTAFNRTLLGFLGPDFVVGNSIQ